jgi:hypothetical protein
MGYREKGATKKGRKQNNMERKKNNKKAIKYGRLNEVKGTSTAGRRDAKWSASMQEN